MRFRRSLLVVALSAGLAGPALAADPWPAEAVSAATNLTPVEGPEPNEFHADLSGLAWNPATRRLWVVRNGPGADNSKLWALREDGAGGWAVDEKDGRRAEWTGFGDLEDVTLADYAERTVFVIVEGEERIKEFDVSVYGVRTLRNDWNTRGYLPLNGGSGAEGIAFVPDEFLAAQGFVDASGNPYRSRRGMGGLMFVGHQNGGSVFAFDLDRSDGTFDFVGEYRTSYPETAALAFDRSLGALYAWHDDGYDTLEKCRLSSQPVAGQAWRRLDTIRVFTGPDHANNEGMALFPVEECRDGHRPFLMAVDDGGPNSLFQYRHFSEGCESLTVDAARGDAPPERLQLRWNLGPAPYTLRRATTPGFRDSVVLVDRQDVTAYDDDVMHDGQTYFYRLD